MYPVVQSYIATMPDGQLRNFLSVEQMQMELASYEQRTPVMQENTGYGGQGYGVQRSVSESDSFAGRASGVEMRVYRYGEEDRKGTKDEVLRRLASEAGRQQPLPFDTENIPIPNNGDGIAILIFSSQKIAVEYRGDGGRQVYDIKSTDFQGGKLYSCLVTLTLGEGDEPTGKLLVTEDGKVTIYGFKETH